MQDRPRCSRNCPKMHSQGGRRCGMGSQGMHSGKNRSCRRGATRRISTWHSETSAAPKILDLKKASSPETAKISEARSAMEPLALPTRRLAPAALSKCTMLLNKCCLASLSRRWSLNFGSDLALAFKSTDFGPTFGRFRAIWVERGRFRAKLGPLPAKFGRCLANVGRSLSMSGQSWSIPVRIWLKLVDWPKSVEIRSHLVASMMIELMWGHSARIWKTRTVSAPCRPSSVRHRPTLDEFDRIWPSLGRNLPAFQEFARPLGQTATWATLCLLLSAKLCSSF